MTSAEVPKLRQQIRKKAKTRKTLVEQCRKWSDKDLAWYQRFVNLMDVTDQLDGLADQLEDTINQTEEKIETTQNIEDTPYLEGRVSAFKELLKSLR